MGDERREPASVGDRAEVIAGPYRGLVGRVLGISWHWPSGVQPPVKLRVEAARTIYVYQREIRVVDREPEHV